MFEVHQGGLTVTIAPSGERLRKHLRMLDGVTRGPMPAVWVMGVSCSALRLPDDLTRHERLRVEAVERGLGRSVRVSSGVHDFVLLESQGETPLGPGPTPMEQICREAEAQLREAGVADGLRYKQEGDGEGVWDPERLAQPISYLVECAAGVAPADEPDVRLNWKGGAKDVVQVVERSVGPGDTREGIDLEWGADVDGGNGDGVSAAVASAILLQHGGSLARFASSRVVAYVASVPRHPAQELS